MYQLQEMAEMEGDTEKAGDLRTQLEDLEERAIELDRRRTNNISGIRFVVTSCRLPDLLLNQEFVKSGHTTGV
jgi:hypothetical protein